MNISGIYKTDGGSLSMHPLRHKTSCEISHKNECECFCIEWFLETYPMEVKLIIMTVLTWSQGQMIPPKHIKRYPMATRHTQTTSENIRSSFLNTGSTQTRINIAKKIARAVGTVIKNATWSSTSWKQRKMKRKLKTNVLKGQTSITYSKLIVRGDGRKTWLDL